MPYTFSVFIPPDLAPEFLDEDEDEQRRRRVTAAATQQALPAKRRPAARSGEIWGQCSRCLDFFSLYVYETQGQLRLAETPRVFWSRPNQNQKPSLLHTHPFAPHVGAGKVHLYGNLDRFAHVPRHTQSPRSA